MTAGLKDGEHVHNDLISLLPAGKSLPIVSLRTPAGERRFPVDLLREDVQPLPSSAWVVFQGEDLGDSPMYTADLLRRLTLMKCNWIARASLRFTERADLLELAQQSHCRGLLFDGEQICTGYLTPDSTTSPEALARMTQAFQHLADHGLFTIVHFVFGYDTDDESVFERVARFCVDARIGLPLFSIVTPQPESPLFTTLDQAGRLRHKDFTQYDGAHVVFQPKLMTPEALENGLHWTRQHVYTGGAIWRRVFSWSPYVFQHLLTNYQQRRLFLHAPQGVYTEAMRLLRQLAQPIPVREQGSFISPLKDAVGETKRHLQGAWLRVRAVRDAHVHALTLRLEGVLDASGAKEVLQRIHEAIRAGHKKVVLDLNGLELVSHTVLTRFLEENAPALTALHGQVVFRHLRTALDAMKANLGGVLPNAELFELATEEG